MIVERAIISNGLKKLQQIELTLSKELNEKYIDLKTNLNDINLVLIKEINILKTVEELFDEYFK